jgi:alcohol dehydrogenase (cytochrome c)
VVNRGAVHADGKLIYNTLDAQTITVDAASGQEVWRRQMGNIAICETMTMAPLVAGDKVLVGNSGGEMGVRGWIAALDIGSGETVWKAFSTGRDLEVLIGPDFNPHAVSTRARISGSRPGPRTCGSTAAERSGAGPRTIRS